MFSYISQYKIYKIIILVKIIAYTSMNIIAIIFLKTIENYREILIKKSRYINLN